MKTKQQAWLLDIDGVLCDSIRDEHTEQFKQGDYSVFERNIPNYNCFSWAVSLVSALAESGHKILFVTARDSAYRAETLAWLSKHIASDKIYSQDLYMRSEGDTRDDHVIKRELFEVFKDRYNILAAIDDNLDNCRLWKSLGITALTNTIKEV